MSPLTIYTLRHLTARPLSTLFALVSMSLVSFALASLSSIGVGVSSVFDTKESTSIVLVRSRDSDSEWTSSLRIEDVGRVTSRTGVKRFSIERQLVSALVPRPGERVDYLWIRGIDPDGWELHGARVLNGRLPDANAEELVVGEAIWKHYPDRLAIGTTIEVHSKYNFKIVGVFRTGTPLDNELWTNRATIERRVNEAQRATASSVYLETTSPEVAETLAKTLTTERGSVVEATVAKQWRTKVASKGFKPLYRWLVIINVVVGFGVLLAAASQMTILLLRRSSDMTVLRVLGYPFSRVVLLVIMEVQIIAILGATIGTVLAAFGLRGVSLQAAGPSVGVNFEPKLTLGIVVMTFAIQIVLGLLAVVVPIVRLARSDLARELR